MSPALHTCNHSEGAARTVSIWDSRRKNLYGGLSCPWKDGPHVKHGLFSLMIAWRIPDLKSCAVVSQRSMQAESEQSEEYGSVGTFLQSPSPLTLSLALHFHIQKHNRATYRQPSFRKQAHAPRGRISWDKVEQCHAGPRLQPSWNSWVGWRVGPPDRLRQNALA